MGLMPPTRFCVRRRAGYVRPVICARSAMIMFAKSLSDEIGKDAQNNYYRTKLEGIDGADRLDVAANGRQHQERRREDAERTRDREATRHAIRARQARLAESQRHQRGKLQENAKAGEQDIQQDELGEA